MLPLADVGQNLPSYYKKSRYIKALNTPVNAEFERLYELIEMFMKNRFIDSADEDAVREYEKSLSMVKAKPPISYHLILIQYIFYHMIPFSRDKTVKI